MSSTTREGVHLALRVWILPAAALVFILAIAGGLSRLFPNHQVGPTDALVYHGLLAVYGFFAVVTSLERAVTLRYWWGYSAPILGLAGAATLIVGTPQSWSFISWVGSMSVLIAVLAALAYRKRSIGRFVTLAASVFGLGGIIAWHLGASSHQSIAWWTIFLVGTMAGERLQFGKVPNTRPIQLIWLILGLFAGVSVFSSELKASSAALGVFLLFAGITNAAFDLPQRSSRSPLLKFILTGLCLSYFWLVSGGLMWLASAYGFTFATRDAYLHSIFVGFAVGMLFTHAPLVFPALMRLRLPFHRAMYGPLILLQLGVAMRVLSGAAQWTNGVRAGALLMSLALVGFALVSGHALITGRGRAPNRAR